MNSVGDLGRLLAVGIGGPGFERRHAGGLRIGVVPRCPPRPGPRKTTTKRCSFTGSTKTSTPGIFTSRSLMASGAAFFAGDAAGAAVGDVARGVERAEVRADGDVAFLQFKADAGGLERAAADEVLQRIVAEQTEVAGAAAGAMPGLTGMLLPRMPLLRECVEVGRLGGFEFGESAGMLRQAAEAVGDEHDDLASRS